MDRPDPSTSTGTVAAIVVAGGAGARFGGAKQYEDLHGRRVLDWSLDAARKTCDTVVLVVPAALVDHDEPDADVVVAGGETRSASVRAGLAAVPESATVVVVHDAARPLARPELFEAVIGTVRAGADAAVPGVAVVDTLRLRSGEVLDVTRDDLVAVQTPQAFGAEVLRRVHAEEADATDDASLVDAAGGSVVVVPGDPLNRKITDPVDLLIADVLALASERS
jgi:2-C-methyl-D-erythritol 4-phosphate cytidylyltransferase